MVHSTTFTAGELEWPEPNDLVDPIPGFDVSGVVIAVPRETPKSGITYYSPGTRVYGLTSFSRHGNARSASVAEHQELSEIPDSLDFNAAASIPLSALTAWQALFVHAQLQPQAGANDGKRILVTAASGGVGTWLTQLASWSGASVTGTCGRKNLEFVSSLGATQVLDYVTTSIKDWITENPSRQFDIVIDCVGGETLEEAWSAVADDGILNTITTPVKAIPPPGLGKHNVRTFGFIVEPNGNHLTTIGKLVAAGTIRSQIDSIWQLAQYRDAWEKVKNGHVSGKVVLQIVKD